MFQKLKDQHHAYIVYMGNMIENDLGIIKTQIDQVFDILEDDYLNNHGNIEIEKIQKQMGSFKDVKITTL